jgi:hypothetical protein
VVAPASAGLSVPRRDGPPPAQGAMRKRANRQGQSSMIHQIMSAPPSDSDHLSPWRPPSLLTRCRLRAAWVIVAWVIVARASPLWCNADELGSWGNRHDSPKSSLRIRHLESASTTFDSRHQTSPCIRYCRRLHAVKVEPYGCDDAE